MSLARFDPDDTAQDKIARCKRLPRDLGYEKLYGGTQRELTPGERASGAVAVVELRFGGRAVLFEDPASPELRIVRLQP